MRKELGLSQTEIGFLEDALLLSYVVLALVFGRLGDRYSRTKLMAAAAAIWSLATGLTALTDKSPWLPSALQFRVPVLHFTIALSVSRLPFAPFGLWSESANHLTRQSLLRSSLIIFPLQRRATALGVFQAAIPRALRWVTHWAERWLTFLAGALAFMVVGLPGLITAVIVWRFERT